MAAVASPTPWAATFGRAKSNIPISAAKPRSPAIMFPAGTSTSSNDSVTIVEPRRPILRSRPVTDTPADSRPSISSNRTPAGPDPGSSVTSVV